jgi:acyl-CoA reductase-like NAD-dependent aldehyde dehydrogenase
MSRTFKCKSPIDGSLLCERSLATEDQVRQVLEQAVEAQNIWGARSIEERTALCSKFIDIVAREKQETAEELTRQMGRPIIYSPLEITRFQERANYMISIAKDCLKDIIVEQTGQFTRCIKKEPIGVVLVIFAWNYPYLTACNCFIPALLAGNSVILKASNKTPLVAERLVRTAKLAGFPEHVFQVTHLCIWHQSGLTCGRLVCAYDA